jgi:hypothetical protein
LLLLSLIELAADAAPLVGKEDRFDFDIFFATIATSATNVQDATTINAIFLEPFSVSTGVVTLPVAVTLTVLFLSDVTVEFVAGLNVGTFDMVGTIEMVGTRDTVGTGDMMGTAVGFVKIAVGALEETGKLIDKLNERLSSNIPRELLYEFKAWNSK